jgi:hypothetical protein
MTRSFNFFEHTVLNWNSYISNLSYRRSICSTLMKQSLALRILTTTQSILSFFLFLVNDLYWALLFNDQCIILPCFDLVFNQLQLISVSFILTLKVVYINDCSLVSFLESDHLKFMGCCVASKGNEFVSISH